MKLNYIIDFSKWKEGNLLDIKDWLEKTILQKITRKPFRKQKLSEKWKNDIMFSIINRIKEKKPLNIVLLFWGYKHFWNSSSPEVDWAELFFIDHIIEWLKPILSIYKPGIIFTFASEDIILDVMNWYNIEDLEKYSNSFNDMLDKIKKYFPSNFKIEYIRMGKDIYNGEFVKKEVLSLVDERIKEFEDKDEEYQKQYLYRTKRNINKSNITLEDEIRAKMIEDVFYEVEEKYSEIFFTDDKIYITLTWWKSKEENIFEWLSIWSTRASIVDFWIWKWILEDNWNKIIKKIVSQNQFKCIKDKLKINYITENIFENKNFDKLDLLSTKLEII